MFSFFKKKKKKVNSVFKKIEIQMTDPICGCDDQNLTYAVNVNSYSRCFNMTIECQYCKTAVTIPSTEWHAYVRFDKPYPGGSI